MAQAAEQSTTDSAVLRFPTTRKRGFTRAVQAKDLPANAVPIWRAKNYGGLTDGVALEVRQGPPMPSRTPELAMLLALADSMPAADLRKAEGKLQRMAEAHPDDLSSVQAYEIIRRIAAMR